MAIVVYNILKTYKLIFNLRGCLETGLTGNFVASVGPKQTNGLKWGAFEEKVLKRAENGWNECCVRRQGLSREKN